MNPNDLPISVGEAIQEALAAKEGDDDEEEPDEDRCLQPPNDIPTAKLPLNPKPYSATHL